MKVFGVHTNRHSELLLLSAFWLAIPSSFRKLVFSASSPAWKCCQLAQLSLRLTEKLQATDFGITAENSEKYNAAFSVVFSYIESNNSKTQVQTCLV